MNKVRVTPISHFSSSRKARFGIRLPRKQHKLFLRCEKIQPRRRERRSEENVVLPAHGAEAIRRVHRETCAACRC